MAANRGHFDILEGFPPDVIAVSANGRIDAEAYDDQLIPLIEDRLTAQGKVKLLYVMGPEFEGFSFGAALEDARFGLRHLTDFARIAVVSDLDWVRLGIKAFSPLVRGEVRVFAVEEIQAAKEWIVLAGQGSAERDGDAGDRASTLKDLA